MRAEGHLAQPAGHTAFGEPQDAIDSLICQCTLLAFSPESIAGHKARK